MTMSAARPFDGIRVIEFGQFVAVPFCAQLLAEGGADVIKIESLEGDPTRQLGQLAEMETRTFLSRNRGKRSLPLQLRHPRALEVIDALLRGADVVLMNFRPGLAERIGLGTAELRERYPRLIIGSVTAFGRRGPDAHLAGMDIVVQARSGLMVANGRSSDGRPQSGDPVSADYMCAMSLAFGIASALLRRGMTGEGGEVHATLMQAAMTLNNTQMLRVEGRDDEINAESRRVLDELRGRGADYDEQRAGLPVVRSAAMLQVYFRTYATADGWIAIACGSPRLRRRFIDTIGVDDPHAEDGRANDAHFAEVRARAEAAVAARSIADWEAALAEAGVPASGVLFPFELFDDLQAEANGMFHDAPHPSLGSMRVLAPPIELDNEAFQPARVMQPFATETADILAEHGFSEAQIAELEAEGAIRTA